MQDLQPPGNSHTPKNYLGQQDRLVRCSQVAATMKLVLKIDFGVSLALCDATYPPQHDLHEIVYWNAAELTNEPGLFEGIIRKAVTWDAQFIYTIERS